MKKLIIFGIVFMGSVFIQTVNAQNSCSKVHKYCTNLLPDEEIDRKWLFDNQSKSATFEKGKTYEMSFIAYKDHVYRISTCTDMGDSKVNFQVSNMEMVRITLDNGEKRTRKQKVPFYNNNKNAMKSYYKFKVEKTAKIYVSIKIPAEGESSSKEYKDSDNVCVGVLLQRQKIKSTGFGK